MGFESYRVELRGGHERYSEAREAICRLENLAIDHNAMTTPGSAFFLRNDGEHKIEVELMDSPMKLSCRFTLSHPPSVDLAFLGLVRELMVLLGMDVTICDDVLPEQTRCFSIDRFQEFSGLALDSIASRRREWIGAFGIEQIAATTSEVFERIILPHCETGAATQQAKST